MSFLPHERDIFWNQTSSYNLSQKGFFLGSLAPEIPAQWFFESYEIQLGLLEVVESTDSLKVDLSIFLVM